MRFPFPGFGVVFDIDGLGGGFYGHRAWQLFMRCLDPKRLCGSILVEGDTSATLSGEANEFCIGTYGLVLDVVYVRQAFEDLDEPGLAPVHRRFIEKLALDAQPLPICGRIDAAGRWVTKSWTRLDHDLCKVSGWGYSPEEVPSDIEPLLREELEQLNQARFD